jgi:hypothetical protein
MHNTSLISEARYFVVINYAKIPMFDINPRVPGTELS